METLLSLCNTKQQSFFTRMYPDGVSQSQLKHAIFQLENTFRVMAKKQLDVPDQIESQESKIEELEIIIDKHETELSKNQATIKSLKRHVERLTQ